MRISKVLLKEDETDKLIMYKTCKKLAFGQQSSLIGIFCFFSCIFPSSSSDLLFPILLSRNIKISLDIVKLVIVTVIQPIDH